VDENCCLTSRKINSDEFDFERKTAQNIKIWFNNKLSELKINKKYLIVSDNASNLVTAFCQNRIPCICHSINLTIQSAVNELINEKSENFCVEFHEILEIIKKPVNHFKHTGLNKNLSHSLKPMMNTRWNSSHVMLKSIHLEFESIIEILKERNEIHRYSIDKNLLDSIIFILKPFNKAIDDLSSSSVPTLNIVIPKIQTLKNSLKPLTDEKILLIISKNIY
jgi:hypothetical protein